MLHLIIGKPFSVDDWYLIISDDLMNGVNVRDDDCLSLVLDAKISPKDKFPARVLTKKDCEALIKYLQDNIDKCED